MQVYRALTATTAAIPGATVENNKFCLSVHFRCVQEEVRRVTNHDRARERDSRLAILCWVSFLTCCCSICP